jgi:hypothetical protein
MPVCRLGNKVRAPEVGSTDECDSSGRTCHGPRPSRSNLGTITQMKEARTTACTTSPFKTTGSIIPRNLDHILADVGCAPLEEGFRRQLRPTMRGSEAVQGQLYLCDTASDLVPIARVSRLGMGGTGAACVGRPMDMWARPVR